MVNIETKASSPISVNLKPEHSIKVRKKDKQQKEDPSGKNNYFQRGRCVLRWSFET